MTSVLVAVALGSNLGDRAAHLEHGFTRLASLLSQLQRSSVRETEAWGVEPQPPFLNAVATGYTTLSARKVLAMLLSMEAERGRVRARPGQPRTLDLDLILYGQEIVGEPGLQVPHPRFRERLFVLEPLAELAADWIDPVTGKTVRKLTEELCNVKRET